MTPPAPPPAPNDRAPPGSSNNSTTQNKGEPEMQNTQPGTAPDPGITQDQVDDLYALILTAQGEANRVLAKAARVRASMAELLGTAGAAAAREAVA
jgi:hypothetical protein